MALRAFDNERDPYSSRNAQVYFRPHLPEDVVWHNRQPTIIDTKVAECEIQCIKWQVKPLPQAQRGRQESIRVD